MKGILNPSQGIIFPTSVKLDILVSHTDHSMSLEAKSNSFLHQCIDHLWCIWQQDVELEYWSEVEVVQNARVIILP